METNRTTDTGLHVHFPHGTNLAGHEVGTGFRVLALSARGMKGYLLFDPTEAYLQLHTNGSIVPMVNRSEALDWLANVDESEGIPVIDVW